jgi:hypothetical protein
MVDFDTLKRTAFAWQDGARELICAANIYDVLAEP